MTKAQIIQEIKRTAEANAGIPLGWKKFLLETGVKESDWFGKYWARWSDALREAGFSPNEFSQEGYAKSELLEKYAALVRQLGRLPTGGDLRLKTNQDSDFPSDKPFRQFGSKADLVKALCEYCRAEKGYEDVVRLCEGYSPLINTVADSSADQIINIGFVYLIKSGRFYKIGKTNALGRREYELGVQLPEKTTTIHSIKTDDPQGIEEYWHKRFEQKRKNGEWFNLSAEDIATFKRRKFM